MDSEFPPKIIVVGMNEYDEPQFLTYGIANKIGDTNIISFITEADVIRR